MIADLLVPDVRLDYYQQETPTDDKDYDGLDRFGRVKDQYWDGYGTTSDVDRFHYGHDYAGNRTYRDIDSAIYGTDDNDQTYDYDGLHRLKDYQQGTYSGGSISSNKSHRQQWGLDALGNWSAFKEDATDGSSWDLEQTRYHNKVNEIDGNSGDPITASTGDDWYDPTFDAGGDMVTGPKPGAPKDDDPDGRKLRHTYDAWNRLVEVEESPTNTTSWSILEQYEYDGRGWRIVKQTAYSEGSPQDTYDYYHNANWQVVEERKDADTDPVAQYVWHPYYIDAPAVRWYDADTDGVLTEDNDGEYYYAHDANFNVTCLMDSGGAVERYHYTPYGEVTIYTDDWSSTRSSSLYANPYLYTGREHDAETGLYYYRARYYHARLGRFLSRDPIGYDGADVNLYGYVGNQPLQQFDPLGLTKYVPDTKLDGGPSNLLYEYNEKGESVKSTKWLTYWWIPIPKRKGGKQPALPKSKWPARSCPAGESKRCTLKTDDIIYKQFHEQGATVVGTWSFFFFDWEYYFVGRFTWYARHQRQYRQCHCERIAYGYDPQTCDRVQMIFKSKAWLERDEWFDRGTEVRFHGLAIPAKIYGKMDIKNELKGTGITIPVPFVSGDELEE